MSLLEDLNTSREILIIQRRELAEIFGFETRNKYVIETNTGRQIGFAAEQQKGFFGFILRQLLGHWRRFEILIYDIDRTLVLKAVHPFRWFFQRLEIFTASGRLLGALQQRFGLFSKRLDLEDDSGKVIMNVASPFWRLWTFKFFNNHGHEVGRVEKKWSGLLTEVFLDSDRFKITFTDSTVGTDVRTLLVAAGLFIDLQYFEHKANSD